MSVVYIRTKTYFCPHCKKQQGLFTFKPLFINTWTCTKCGKPFRLTFKAIADNWVNTAFFWGLFPSCLFSLSLVWTAPTLFKKFLALILAVPLFTACGALLFYVAAMPIALAAAAVIQNRTPEGAEDCEWVEWELD
jgi:hypothetical protein